MAKRALILAFVALLDCRPIMAAKVEVIYPEILARDLAKVSVLDAREEKDFTAGHVPGSQRFDWREWTESKPNFWTMLLGRAPRWGKALSDPSILSERLSALGLSHDRRIVVVGQPGGWGEEGRVAWNLLYWGAEDVALLDGGFPAWKAMELPIETGKAKSPARGRFVARIDASRRATREQVEEAIRDKSRPLVDNRTREEFEGKAMAGQKRGGRLPGAVLLPALDLYRRDGGFVTAEMLTSVFPASAAAPIGYCTGGVRSGLFAVLYEARTGKKAANYDGSLWEWAADESLPLESGPKGK